MRNNGEAARAASGAGGPRGWLAANSGNAVIGLSIVATIVAATALIFDAIDRLGARLANVEAGQRAIETTVGSLQTTVGGLRTAVEGLQTSVGQLQAGQRALEAGQRELGIAVQNIQTTGRGLEDAMRELNWRLGRADAARPAARCMARGEAAPAPGARPSPAEPRKPPPPARRPRAPHFGLARRRRRR